MSGGMLRTLGYGDKSRKVAFFPELTPVELNSILQTVFGFSGTVVAMQSSVSVAHVWISRSGSNLHVEMRMRQIVVLARLSLEVLLMFTKGSVR